MQSVQGGLQQSGTVVRECGTAQLPEMKAKPLRFWSSVLTFHWTFLEVCYPVHEMETVKKIS